MGTVKKRMTWDEFMKIVGAHYPKATPEKLLGHVKKTKKTYNLLNKAISIPIWFKRPVDEYIEIGKFIKSLK